MISYQNNAHSHIFYWKLKNHLDKGRKIMDTHTNKSYDSTNNKEAEVVKMFTIPQKQIDKANMPVSFLGKFICSFNFLIASINFVAFFSILSVESVILATSASSAKDLCADSP